MKLVLDFEQSHFGQKKIEKNVYKFIEAIYNEFFYTYAFDFEGNYDRLIKKFCHMSVFSVCLQYLRCGRSSEKKSGYCKVCLKVRENTFYDYNAFLSLKVSDIDNYLDISSSLRIDLDVF